MLRRREDVERALAPAAACAGGALEEYFTTAELDYCAGRPGSLGARLLIKDCVFEHMASELAPRERRYHEVEITRNERMGPVLALFGVMEERARRSAMKEIRVSISHSRNWIAGMVLFCY